MLQLKDVVHENLNVFVGACVDPPNLCLLWHYCSKGSLNVSSKMTICQSVSQSSVFELLSLSNIYIVFTKHYFIAVGSTGEYQKSKNYKP